MDEGFSEKAKELMAERFGRDALIALATVEDGEPRVRTVNAYYEDGAFYVITHALSGKMRQIAKHPAVAIAGDWFTAQGVGENKGYIRLAENAEIARRLRAVFAAWYDNGHTDETDINTCILCIHLTKGVLFAQRTRYDIDFAR
jgi:uncharacterized pyridoxamine 5'-phosphate oxidase family protein